MALNKTRKAARIASTPSVLLLIPQTHAPCGGPEQGPRTPLAESQVSTGTFGNRACDDRPCLSGATPRRIAGAARHHEYPDHKPPSGHDDLGESAVAAATQVVVEVRPKSTSPDGPKPRRRSSALTFFLFVFAWSWLWWLAAGLTGVPVTEPPATNLALIGGLGPLLAAILLVFRNYPADERREFCRRLCDPRRVGWRWWLAIPALAAGPTVIGWLATSQGDFSVGVSSTGAASVGVVVWLVFAAGAALVEEPGWRGYALDALLERHSMVVSSAVLGSVWAMWHLPQFFLEGTYQHDEVGFATGLFWMFMTAIVAQTFLYVWVVTNTGGSILAAIVFHALTNLAGETLSPSPTGELVALIIWVAAAAILGVYWWRSQGLSKANRQLAGVGSRQENPPSRRVSPKTILTKFAGRINPGFR